MSISTARVVEPTLPNASAGFSGLKQGAPVSAAKNKFVRNWSSAQAPLSSIGSGNESTNVSSTEPFFKFQNANDIVGIVMLEIQNAFDLPRLQNCAFDFFSSLR